MSEKQRIVLGVDQSYGVNRSVGIIVVLSVTSGQVLMVSRHSLENSIISIRGHIRDLFYEFHPHSIWMEATPHGLDTINSMVDDGYPVRTVVISSKVKQDLLERTRHGIKTGQLKLPPSVVMPDDVWLALSLAWYGATEWKYHLRF